MRHDSHFDALAAQGPTPTSSGSSQLATTDGREDRSGAPTQWLVVVIFYTEDRRESETLATALERVLHDVHPIGALAEADRALVALHRRAHDPAEAAFSVVKEMELWGFDPDALASGREGEPVPAFSMERVS